MKKKISLINLSKAGLTKKQKDSVRGGTGTTPMPGMCLCNANHYGECGRFDRKTSIQ